MAKKQVQKGKQTSPKKVETKTASTDKAGNIKLVRLEKLQADFLALNGNCPSTALLAACELLFLQAEGIQELQQSQTSSIAGFNRRFNQSLLYKS